jgi:hypothetical protein
MMRSSMWWVLAAIGASLAFGTVFWAAASAQEARDLVTSARLPV